MIYLKEYYFLQGFHFHSIDHESVNKSRQDFLVSQLNCLDYWPSIFPPPFLRSICITRPTMITQLKKTLSWRKDGNGKEVMVTFNVGLIDAWSCRQIFNKSGKLSTSSNHYSPLIHSFGSVVFFFGMNICKNEIVMKFHNCLERCISLIDLLAGYPIERSSFKWFHFYFI